VKNAFEKFDLTGKTALITGAAGLLGLEHARALVRSGARVVLTDIDEERLRLVSKTLLHDTSSQSISIQVMDVSSPEGVRFTAEKLTEMGWRIDILVNNAAIDPKVKNGVDVQESSRFENFSIEQWELQIAVGLTGAFLCSQAFGSRMAQDNKGGVILNIASDLSVISPDQRLYRREGLLENMQPVKPVTYSIIKTGLVGLTRYLATYWSDRGVRANALSPGGVFVDQGEEFVKRITSLIPIGRMAARDEYHSAIQFLCSDASTYLNGQNIIMDGGRSVW
jgi:NAD(P)-dependent dehydrogenase (short-subunit alcohol dehydrogenase family)